MDELKKILDLHRDKIMETPGVVSVGIEFDPRTSCVRLCVGVYSIQDIETQEIVRHILPPGMKITFEEEQVMIAQ